MDRQILAILIQEGTKFLSQCLRFRAIGTEAPDVLGVLATKSQELADREQSIQAQGGQTESRSPHKAEIAGSIPAPATTPPEPPTANKASAIATGCVPCALGHYGACTGILNEAVRFSHGEDGMASQEVLDRVGMCMDELNAMERVDLRPQMITQLPDWERELAQKALEESRAIRHTLEGMTDSGSLEEVAGRVQGIRQELYRTWAKKRLKNMTPAEKTEVTSRILSKLESEEE